MRFSHKTDRRDFLRRGLSTAAAAIAAPYIIPRHVLGMGSTPGANQQIVVAIVGMGMRGNQLGKNIPAGGRIAAICDADARKTTAAMEKFAATWDVYDDYQSCWSGRT